MRNLEITKQTCKILIETNLIKTNNCHISTNKKEGYSVNKY